MKYLLVIGITITIILLIAILDAKRFFKCLIEHMDQVSAGIIHYYIGQDPENARDKVAKGLAMDFGLAENSRAWLVETCPYPSEECKNCEYWTCPGKEIK